MCPVGSCCLIVFSVLVCYWVPTNCYPNGKVTQSCNNMKPQHHADGQTTESPYQINTNTTTFSPGDHIQVIVTGKLSGKFFEGFLLQARDAANESSVSTVGTFTLTDPSRTQLLTCNHHQGSAVSHTSDAKLEEVVVTWNSPQDAPKEIQFFVTVVEHYNIFWVKQPGPIIHQHGFTPRPPQSTTAPTTVQTTTPSVLPGPFTSDGCGLSKSCLLDPPGCDPAKDPHCFFLSMATEGPNKMSAVFEMSGPQEGYMAFALSWDTWMGNDDVYMCVKDGNKVSVSAAFVSGRTHPEKQSQTGLSSVSWRLSDGLIQCKFSRPVKLNSEDPARFDLDREYFVFLASGHVEYGNIRRHSRQPLISTHKKRITGRPEVLRGSHGPLIMKMHGALMLLAWMLTGSVGTIIASFYKPDWPNQTLLGQRVWFQVHRGLMIVTVTLTVVAFCLPFFYRKGWSKHAGVHPYLGCCVLVLSLIQPIGAVFRPPPDSHRRFIFNWVHRGVGYMIEILAVAAMFLGMQQSSLLLPLPWGTHVMIGYVVWLALFRFLLVMHKHFYKRKALESDEVGILSEQSHQGSFIKSIILAALALGNSSFLIALLISIGEI